MSLGPVQPTGPGRSPILQRFTDFRFLMLDQATKVAGSRSVGSIGQFDPIFRTFVIRKGFPEEASIANLEHEEDHPIGQDVIEAIESSMEWTQWRENLAIEMFDEWTSRRNS
ncbi:hypothetical protein PIB30_038854 [Stylosanthes scabra]|uniref:Uncharacterized protein n=1 Tax=Stylosanthes scabra TaxID=79078 RepID=A0ABU6VCW8_9FABA|nr:hypothetical protein [Stylosanthes scabra]